MKNHESINQKKVFAMLAFLAIAYASYLAIYYSAQPPLDAHAFRQTQTALTAYWFIQDGFSWAYETPVIGTPWALPFEFPLYQMLVSAISGAMHFSLDSAGRILSFVFLLATLYPVWSVTKKLKLDKSIFYIFAALLFCSPIYIYWGRTFMIETTALFLAVAAIKFFVDAIVDGFDKKLIVLFSAFMTLSILQKVTTAFPILFVVSLSYFVYEFNEWRTVGKLAWQRILTVGFVCFFIPLVVGYTWVIFTDHIKMMNPVGQQLTSSALHQWNWGSLEQRYSSKLFEGVIWGRIFSDNLGGLIGISIISAGFFCKNKYRLKAVLVVTLLMGLLPLFLFTNLHIVHDYYQSANAIFIIYALAVSLEGAVLPRFGLNWTAIILIFIMISNYGALYSGYLSLIKREFSRENRHVAIGEILKREVPVGGQFVAFGNDWSSTFSYMAERKSFTAPTWFEGYASALENPEQYVEQGKLGAIVSCARGSLERSSIFKTALRHSWKIGESHGCLIATPQKQAVPAASPLLSCLGSIDGAAYIQRDGISTVSISGWSTMHDNKADFPQTVYIIISNDGGDKSYFEALKVPRPDINRLLSVDDSNDAGFSAVIPAQLTPGEYRVNIMQSKEGVDETCQYNKRLVINE
ncbi:glycosyltransferase family protein [Porticoccus sp.]